MNPLRSVQRALRRDAGITVLAVVTLALALGAVTAIFAVVDGILLESLPYPDSERLIDLDHAAPGLDLDQMGISIPLYLHYRERAETLAEIGLFAGAQATLTGDGEPEQLAAASVTASLFRALAVPAHLGRAFEPEDEAPGAAPVAMLSERVWRSRYGADPGVVGRTLELDSQATTVIGVMPASFEFPGRDTDVWRPLTIDPERSPLGAFRAAAVARLAPGVGPEELESDLARLTTGLAEWFPEETSAAAPVLDRAGFRARTRPLLESMVGDLRPVLWVLFGTVAIILAIACANVANLFLVRVEERAQELGLRGALGASRRRLIAELMLESTTIAAIAGGLGLLLARGLVPVFQRYGPEDTPRLHQVAVDAEVVIFALATALAAGLLFGSIPALRGTAGRLVGALREQARGATASRTRHRLRGALVATQVALGLVLLIGSGLVMRSLLELRRVDPGFDPESALTFRVSLPPSSYPEGEDRARFVDLALERLTAIPGVTTAGASSALPLSGRNDGSGYRLEDFPSDDAEPPIVFMRTRVSPGYLEALGVELIEGRLLRADDSLSRTGNVVISRSIADAFWPGQSALGKRFRQGNDDRSPWHTVVGVIGDLRHARLDEDPVYSIHVPLLSPEEDGERDDAGPTFSFLLRTSVEPTALVPVAREALHQLDPDLPLTVPRTLDDIVRAASAAIGFTVLLLTIASGLALVLATVGLYGVVSYLVARRTHEIGIRMALGARRSEVSWMVLRSSLAVVGAGVAAGLALAVVSTRWLDSLLYQVGRFDPLVFAAVPVILTLVAMAASWAPAHRAAGIEPSRALRGD